MGLHGRISFVMHFNDLLMNFLFDRRFLCFEEQYSCLREYNLNTQFRTLKLWL